MSPRNWADTTTALCRLQTKLRYTEALASYNQGPALLLHFGSTVTTTLVSCHRHCKLQAVRRMEENTATWWKKGIGNICNCSNYKYFHRDVPSHPIPNEFLNSMAGAAPPVPPQPHPSTALGCLHSPTFPSASWLYSYNLVFKKAQKAKGDNFPFHLCLKASIKDDMEVWNQQFQTKFSFASLLLFSNPYLSCYTGMAGITFYLYLFPLIYIFSSCRATSAQSTKIPKAFYF